MRVSLLLVCLWPAAAGWALDYSDGSTTYEQGSALLGDLKAIMDGKTEAGVRCCIASTDDLQSHEVRRGHQSDEVSEASSADAAEEVQRLLSEASPPSPSPSPPVAPPATTPTRILHGHDGYALYVGSYVEVAGMRTPLNASRPEIAALREGFTLSVWAKWRETSLNLAMDSIISHAGAVATRSPPPLPI